MGGKARKRGAVAAGLSAMTLGLLGKPLDKSQQVRHQLTVNLSGPSPSISLLHKECVECIRCHEWGLVRCVLRFLMFVWLKVFRIDVLRR